MANARTIVALLFLGAFSLIPVLDASGDLVAPETTKQREFDYFVLALQWPGTYCRKTKHCCSKNGCCRSQALTEFTIHGLWTDYNDGSWPSCCGGSSSDFDMKKISSLIPLLDKYWPSLSCSSSSLCHGGKGPFWGHEWEKHGTCSYPVIKDEYSYFNKTLELYSKYNITRILESAGIQASNGESYPVKDIIATIKKAVGTTPSLDCKHDALEELHLCFYKDFTPRDCDLKSSILPGSSILKSSCHRTVSLPTYAPIGLGDENDALNSLADE